MKYYKHNKTGKKYFLVGKSKIKIYLDDGAISEWKDIVIYGCMYMNKDGLIWTRFVDDFEANFTEYDSD